jgi:DNA-binding HxlR family transcriptional regulator
MQRTDLNECSCPIARALERVGEWWSILILRDALHGLSRFDEFEKSLGIAPNMLTRRLKGLVAAGLLERRPYQSKPLRYEYVPTPAGVDFQQVLTALLAWGNKHFAPEGTSVELCDRGTGAAVKPIWVDANSGKPISSEQHVLGVGPAASALVKRRIDFFVAKRSDPTLRPDFLTEDAGKPGRL